MTEKKPRLKRDWVGRRVALRRKLVTRGGEIFEAGTVMVVKRNYGGLTLEREILCRTCSTRWRGTVKEVSEQGVDLLPVSDDRLEQFTVEEEKTDEDETRCPFCWLPQDKNRSRYAAGIIFECGSDLTGKGEDSATRGTACRIIAKTRDDLIRANAKAEDLEEERDTLSRGNKEYARMIAEMELRLKPAGSQGRYRPH